MPVTLVWLRQDLRLADNPALSWAATRGAVIPLYILDTTDPRPPGGAARWWLHHALQSLAQDCVAHGVPLILRRGDPAQILPALAQERSADAVCWNRCYEPHAVARDTRLKTALRAQGLAVSTHNANLLYEPWDVQTKGGTPFRVFTPFYRACLAAPSPSEPLAIPHLSAAPTRIASENLADWQLLPTRPNWAAGFDWQVSATAAQQRLADFLATTVTNYKTDRDRPDRHGTSRLSPYLHFGQISPRQVWHQTQAAMRQAQSGIISGGESFLRELLWREFCYHLLFYQPQMPQEPLQPAFADFPWRTDAAGLQAWQSGQTGFPLIDAGMRELWQTGWMHNRVRMITASFLIKDLLLPWQAGERWFWDCLVDADLANNAAGWQWVAGCGADAAPYYRIFNPLLQSQKFDPEGDYIRRYVPELAALPAPYIHEPASAPAAVLAAAGVRLGATYPHPLLDHRAAKDRALAALQTCKTRTTPENPTST